MTTLITNAQIVLPDRVERGTLRLHDGKIAEILSDGGAGPAPAQGVEVIDAEGDWLIPGCIDLHGDDIEFEIGALGPRAGTLRMPVELGLLQSDKNAAAWGITTKLHAIAYFEDEAKNRSKRLSGAIMDTIRDYGAAGRLLVEHWVDLRYEVTADPDYTLAAMAHPVVRMISVMDHTPGEGQFADLESYKALNRQITDADDAELERLVAEKRARAHLKTAPEAQVAARAQELGLIIASHDDDSAARVEAWHALGGGLSEMPVRLEAAERAHALGMKVSMAGPNLLRGGSASGNLNLVEALAAGALDAICSDYYPPALVCGAFKLVQDGLIADLPDAIRLVTAGPADALGLSDRGRCLPGLRGDVAQVSTALGHPVVRRTFVAGVLVYEDRRFENRPPATISPSIPSELRTS
jgi:alpha-D-ribose 1-methylphosphonate 5-triphosphate diphosphatase